MIEYEELLFIDEQELLSFLKSQNKDLKEKLNFANAELGRFQAVNGLINHYGKEKLYKIIFNSIKQQKQTKVELLEHLKFKLEEKIADVKVLLDPIEYEDYISLLGVGRGYTNTIKEIDKIIADIQGEK